MQNGLSSHFTLIRKPFIQKVWTVVGQNALSLSLALCITSNWVNASSILLDYHFHSSSLRLLPLCLPTLQSLLRTHMCSIYFPFLGSALFIRFFVLCISMYLRRLSWNDIPLGTFKYIENHFQCVYGKEYATMTQKTTNRKKKKRIEQNGWWRTKAKRKIAKSIAQKSTSENISTLRQQQANMSRRTKWKMRMVIS